MQIRLLTAIFGMQFGKNEYSTLLSAFFVKQYASTWFADRAKNKKTVIFPVLFKFQAQTAKKADKNANSSDNLQREAEYIQ